jgi:histidinol phosphatase-like PHP family hydrolase
LIGQKEVEVAAKNGVFIEITARGGHNVGNGHVVKVGQAAGVNFLVNSDTHAPDNLLTDDWARTVALGAGLNAVEVEAIVTQNPLQLLKRVGLRRLKQ